MANNDNTTAQDRRIDVKGDLKSLARKELLAADDWQRSKFGWALGHRAAVRAALAGVRFLAMPAQKTWAASQGFFSHWKVEPLPTQDKDPSRRFEVARKFHGRDEGDIRMDINTTSKWQSIFLVLTALVLSYGIASLGSLGTNGLPAWLDFISRFSLVPALLAISAQMGFQNWQLRSRRLGSFNEWLGQPKEWLAATVEESNGNPKGPAMGGMASFLLIGGTLTLGAWLGFSPAEAQPTPSSSVSEVLQTPRDGDLWKALLQYMFPHIGPWASSGGGAAAAPAGMENAWRAPQTNAINSAMSVFLAVLMAFASLGLAYFTLVGTISTAHEGRVLGQRWHTFYAPVRVVSGFGMLVPIFNGFCMAQVMVIYLAIWGGSFGNLIWAGYVGNIADRSTVERIEPSTVPFLRQMTMLEACAAITRAEQSNISQFTQGISPLGRSLARGDSANDWVATPQRGRAASGPAATVSPLTAALRNSRPTVELRTFTLDYGACGSVRLPNSVTSGDAPAVAYEEALRRAVLDYRTAIRPEVEKLVAHVNPGQNRTNPSMPDSSALRTAMSNFGSALGNAQDALRSASSNGSGSRLDAVRNSMVQAGWASAGAFYMAISNFHEGFMVTASRMPTITNGALMNRYISEATGNPFRNIGASFATWWDSALTASSPDLSPFVVELSRLGQSDGTAVTGAPFDSIMDLGLLRSTLSHLQIDFSKGSGLDHMIKFGHNLLWVWGVIIGTLLAIVGVSGIVGNTAVGRAIWGSTGIFTGGVASAVSAVASAIFQYFSGILQLLLLVVLVVGMIHAYVLPMIPYIMMFFVIMGMLVLVIEGMVAAPIWALFHVRPDGQEFIEQVQRPGYMILFNLILRIPLAMFGMMFSFLFIDAMMWFESVTFVPAFLGGTSDSGRGYGPIGIIAAFCMLAFLHWQVCLKAFGLITHLPDQVSRWFGQAGERMGEDQDTKTLVGGMVSRSEHKLGAVAGAGIASAAGNKAGSTPKDGGQQSDKVQPGGGLLRNQPRSVAGANTPQTPTSPRGGG